MQGKVDINGPDSQKMTLKSLYYYTTIADAAVTPPLPTITAITNQNQELGWMEPEFNDI